MAELGDEGLAELITREQRGFRRILAAGVATLIVMALSSAILGAYLYVASQRLNATTETLLRHSFDTRRAVDSQTNRVVAQEIAIRRAYEEIRLVTGEADIAATRQNIDAALDVAEGFLLRGHDPLLDERRALDHFGPGGAGSMRRETRALLTGVSHLVDYDSRGEEIDANPDAPMPLNLTEALEAFDVAATDTSLAQLANAGRAWVVFEEASSGRNNYSPQSCERVFEAIAASVRNDVPSPQPLYWRAQCERKLGLTSEALADYARALQASAQAAGEGSRDDAETTLAMNAFHGVGTELIAGADIPDDAEGMEEALAIAQAACHAGGDDYGDRSPRMALALSCLDEAIALRRELGQTPNQLSGSAENKSFAHLRDGDVEAAYRNTVSVERTGLFAWTEVVRALTASQVRFDDPDAQRAAAEAAEDARRNVAMFRVDQFNICELQVLFDAEMFSQARAIIAAAHPREDVGCMPAG